nr:SpaA isopeptide-forming pilin-related protein [Bifidobacterium phasiani]
MAMLCTSVAAGTALAADDEPADATDTTQTQTTQTIGDDDDDDGADDATIDDGQADADPQNGDAPETTDGGTTTNGQSGEPSEDGDSGSQPALQSDDTGVATQALDEHTVQGVTPRGTTINLFDYWVDGTAENPANNGTNQSNGINKGHTLKFGGGGNTSGPASFTNINQYTGNASPRTGIVQSGLSNGYPVLSEATGSEGESLDYLFDPNTEEGARATHTNVGGLLQVDGDGYYYYNSHDNFASYVDGENNDFVLYNKNAVKHGGTSPDGQFFPFNKGADVFNEDGTAKDINSNNSVINHYFGLTMQTNFVQQYGGHVDKDGKQPVTYNFSGDDDVWVFVDGVLVGDLGGIHDATALQIDFSTGEVIIFDDNSAKIQEGDKQVPNPTNPDNGNNHYDAGETVYTETKTTLKKLFVDAGVDTSKFNGDTLPDNTYHTLSFFYMERGNVDSNMSLKYNLVNIPESGVMKVDAVGTPLNGVNFNLYPADSNYTIKDELNPYTATTDSTGNLIFRHPDAGTSQGTPVSLNELGEVSQYWVLKETNVPEGYRSNGDVQLRFAYGDDTTNKGTGPLLVSNQWDSGAYSEPHVTVQADSTVTDIDGASHSLAEGTMFAVVEKKVDGGWLPVYGDPYGGWQFAKDESVNSLAAAGARNIFIPGTSGAYEVTIENLPGDITTYEYMLKHHGGSANDAQYRVKYFYTTGDLTDAVEMNPEVSGSEFTRVFSVTVNLTNPKNELKLVKTDEGGKPLANAEFTLYHADENGAITSDVINTFTTNDNGEIDIANSSGMLPEGKYVLVETKAPDNYAPESTQIPIIVDDDGVHVNAGTADDNVTVTTKPGTLLYSMKGFAANDQVDATLHDIAVQPQNATEQEYPASDASWQNVGTLTHMQYIDDNDKVLNYTPTEDVKDNGDGSYTAHAGWSRLNIQQCMIHGTDSVKTDLSKWEPPVSNLNHLFTGDVTINVTNRRAEASFSIAKTLDGRKWEDTDTFSFTVTLDSGDAENVVLPSSNGTTWGTETNPVVISSSTEKHTVSYGSIVFTKIGKYEFTVEEVEGDIPGVSYSDAVFEVTVEVTDLAVDPQVTVKKTGGTSDDTAVDGTVTFANYYRTVSSLPLTGGDATARNLLLAGGGVLLLAGAAWLLARRKRV